MNRISRALSIALSLSIITLAAACAREPSPGDIASSFLKHLAAGEVNAAMVHLSSEYSVLGEDKLRGALQMAVNEARREGVLDPDLRVEVISEDVQGDFATVVLFVRDSSGDEGEEVFELVREGDEWKISEDNMEK